MTSTISNSQGRKTTSAVNNLGAGHDSGTEALSASPAKSDPLSIEVGVIGSALRGLRELWSAGNKEKRVQLRRDLKSMLRELRGPGFNDPTWRTAALRYIEGAGTLEVVIARLQARIAEVEKKRP